MPEKPSTARSSRKPSKDHKGRDAVYPCRVSDLRNREKLTQEKFAERIGYSETLIKELEAERKKLSIDVAIKISEVFNVSLDWLYKLSDDTNDNASNTLVELRKFFNLGWNEKYKSFSVTVDTEMLNFLHEIQKADQTKVAMEISESLHQSFINEIKARYNARLDSKSDSKPAEFLLYSLEKVEEYERMRLLKGVASHFQEKDTL